MLSRPTSSARPTVPTVNARRRGLLVSPRRAVGPGGPSPSPEDRPPPKPHPAADRRQVFQSIPPLGDVSAQDARAALAAMADVRDEARRAAYCYALGIDYRAAVRYLLVVEALDRAWALPKAKTAPTVPAASNASNAPTLLPKPTRRKRRRGSRGGGRRGGRLRGAAWALFELLCVLALGVCGGGQGRGTEQGTGHGDGGGGKAAP